MLALRRVNGVTFQVGHGPEILCKLKKRCNFMIEKEIDRTLYSYIHRHVSAVKERVIKICTLMKDVVTYLYVFFKSGN